MASDSGVTMDANTWAPSQKVFKAGGCLVGCAGTVGPNFVKFRRWVSRGMPGKGPKIVVNDGNGEPNIFEALVIDRRGRLLYFSADCVAIPIDRDYHAIGAGAQAALGAMFCGADPLRAIQAALAHDCDTRGDPQVLTL